MQKRHQCTPIIAILTTLAVIFILLIFGRSIQAAAAARPSLSPKGTVIVLHGLARTSRSMTYIARGLTQHGYVVENLDYPSTELSIPELSDRYLAPAVARATTYGGPVHIVSHSMGGILVRQYLADHPAHEIDRIVMLAPPNGGSELIDTVARSPLLEKTLGPAACQLTTATTSFANSLPPVSAELGIIAGTRSWNPIFSALVPGEDDGKVSVASTRLPGMQDHLVLAIDHTLIMWNREVLTQTVHFLEHGSFIHSASIH